mgnify:CR=1 FL=1
MKTTGIVTWFNDAKGYGGIREMHQSDYCHDVFVHYTAITGDCFKTLAEGQTVDFEMLKGPKGPQAMNIRKVEAV